MPDSISPRLARRIALAAQGFHRQQSRASEEVRPGARSLTALIERLGLLQVDSVNVFERNHYLPPFSRLGAYDKADLDRLVLGPAPRFTEYVAHEASFLPRTSWPLMRWRMDEFRDRALAEPDSFARKNRPLLDWLLAELETTGPVPASAIEHDANRRRGPWWGWSDVKRGLETLFRWGDVVIAGREGFERHYALPHQVFPPTLLADFVPRAEAHRQLVEMAARAHGIGTVADFADYFRLGIAETKAAARDLAEAGVLVPVRVDGWRQDVWLHRDAQRPRTVEATALLSPFDPVVWDRRRTERMFGFHYRIEIYTPAPKRVFGYYVLPVLVDDQLVGRVDLKNDRQSKLLRVQAAWQEENAPPETAARLAGALAAAARWQGSEMVHVADRGNLSAALAHEVRAVS